MSSFSTPTGDSAQNRLIPIGQVLGRVLLAWPLTDSTDALAARIELGRIFSRGAGVPVNKGVALKWYSAAIELAGDNDDSEELREARAYIQQGTP
jgi:TPR repeat protein